MRSGSAESSTWKDLIALVAILSFLAFIVWMEAGCGTL